MGYKYGENEYMRTQIHTISKENYPQIIEWLESSHQKQEQGPEDGIGFEGQGGGEMADMGFEEEGLGDEPSSKKKPSGSKKKE